MDGSLELEHEHAGHLVAGLNRAGLHLYVSVPLKHGATANLQSAAIVTRHLAYILGLICLPVANPSEGSALRLFVPL